MQEKRSLRHLKRVRETKMARITAAFMIAVIILTMEVSYILSGASRKRAFAEEAADEDVIIIPVNDTGSTSGDEVSGNEKKENKENTNEDSKEDTSKDNSGETEEHPPAPVVKITITEPSGWHRKSAEVKFSAENISGSEDFAIKEVRAKIGQNGSWTNITDTLALECSENCVVYVEFTDSMGRTYSKNKKITCFDSTKPTLNAAVNNGSLTVDTNDNESGVKAVYVNGFEFTDLTEGTLSIRMQQFDTGYESFAIQAMDYAGNMSDTYRVNNPYYKKKDASGKDTKVLPDSAEATKPAEATAIVTDHIKTDETGNTPANTFSNTQSTAAVSENSKSVEKKKSLAEADREERAEAETIPGKGREFYTIEAKSGKVFYLVIDRTGDEEKVHFVTDITENDLLNVIEETSTTLPQNAAMSDSDVAVMESALPNNNTQIDDIFAEDEKEDLFGEESAEENISENDLFPEKNPDEDDSGEKGNPWIFKVILGIAVVLIIVGVRCLNNFVKKRDGDFAEEEDPEEEDPGDDDEDGNEEDRNVNDAFYEEAQ